MTPIGEWDDDPPSNSTAHGAASSAIEAAIGRIDLKAAAANAVATTMQRRLDAITAAAVNQLLKPCCPRYAKRPTRQPSRPSTHPPAPRRSPSRTSMTK